MQMEVRNVTCGYDSRTVLQDISLSMTAGDALCLLGPNGAGKTTLFKAMLGFLKVQTGRILLNGEDISTWSRQRFATKVGYIPQEHTPPFPYKVLDVVVMGRTAHMNTFATPSARDFVIAEEALHTLDSGYLMDRIYTEISGGERQLVLIARALAQQPEILIMDEPTSNLDFGNQVRVLKHVKKLVREGSLSVIMTTHSPNHAFLFASKVAVLGRNNMFAFGAPEEVMTEEKLKAVYGVDVKIVHSGEHKVCLPV